MKRHEQSEAWVYDLAAKRVGKLTVKGGEWQWPEGVGGWMQTLDCTVEPYAESDLASNLERARRSRKRFVARLES